MTNLKTRLATVAAAAAIATGGLVAAVPAQAQAAPGIAAGNYWYEVFSYGFIPSGKAPARVSNGHLTVYGGLGMKNVQRIHATPRGGYIDQGPGQRYLYRKVGRRSYKGDIMWGVVPIGHSVLTPRR
ncbi:hypothetical protein [Gordonia sp. SND2]|uniref:hypothetical protein n=1 Tax=Gordonia sp. SND2 TaxID=3388659 RepID=UPI00398B10B1